MTTLDRDWRSFGRCLDTDPELHQPVGNTGPALLQIQEAKAICARCIVKDTCLDDAMRTEGSAGRNYRHGIRGGLTGDERVSLYQRRTKQAAKARQAVSA